VSVLEIFFVRPVNLAFAAEKDSANARTNMKKRTAATGAATVCLKREFRASSQKRIWIRATTEKVRMSECVSSLETLRVKPLVRAKYIPAVSHKDKKRITLMKIRFTISLPIFPPFLGEMIP